MKWFRLVGFGLLCPVLIGQAPVALADRQEIFFEGQAFIRKSYEKAFHPKEASPKTETPPEQLGTQIGWDGARLYRFRMARENRGTLDVGRTFMSSAGDTRWAWWEPRGLALEGHPSILLAAWDDKLVFLQLVVDSGKVVPESDKSTLTKRTFKQQRIVLIDLGTGRMRPLLDLPQTRDFRYRAAIVNGSVYVFSAAGSAYQIDLNTEPAAVQTLTSSFWEDAGIQLTKVPPAVGGSNPQVFGMPFFDPDGTILIPTQPGILLNRSDIDRAWQRLPKDRKEKMLEAGMWPVPEGKDVGGKEEVYFLRFDPATKKFSQVERSRFAHLVFEDDRTFIFHRFKEVDNATVYTTNGNLIRPFKEVLDINASKAPRGTPKESKPEDAGAAPVEGKTAAESSK